MQFFKGYVYQNHKKKQQLFNAKTMWDSSQKFSLQLGRNSVQLKLSALDHHLENTTLYRATMEPEISTSSALNWEKVETG